MTTFGDKLDLLIPLNQDTMDRHLKLMAPGTAVIYNGDTIQPRNAAEGVRICPLPVKELTDNSRNKLAQNTARSGRCPQHDGRRFPAARRRFDSPVRTEGRRGSAGKRRRRTGRL